MNYPLSSLALLILAAGCFAQDAAVPRMLPTELSAEEVLDGKYPFPPSPEVKFGTDLNGFAHERVSKVPAPGVHPRILLSPGDLPDLRRRLKETETGRALYATLKSRTDAALRNPKEWSSQLYAKLAAGDEAGVLALVDEHEGFPAGIGHDQPRIYAIVMEAFDAMVSEDEVKGRKAATAIATYAALIRPNLDTVLSGPMNDDVWRAKASRPLTGVGGGNQGMREGVGGHLLGYTYDFGYNFMTDTQRATVRGVIATATAVRRWRHFGRASGKPTLVFGTRIRAGAPAA